MAVPILFDIQLITQTILYYAASICGLIISVPVGVTTSNFGGHCLLYTDIDWKNKTFFIYTLSSASTCNFTMYLSVFGCIFYGIGMAAYHTYALCQKDPNTGSQMWVMPFVLTNALVSILVFISSCVVSVGFSEFCSGLTKGKDIGSDVKSCADGEKLDWNKLGHTDYNAKTYYGFMKTAEATSWICTLIWLCQTGLCILRFIRNRWLRSKEMFADSTPSGPPDLEQVVGNTVPT